MKQSHLKFRPQVLPKPGLLDEKLLLNCKNWRDAFKTGLRNSRHNATQDWIAEKMKISSSHFNEMINKKPHSPKYFDFDRIQELEMYLGNTAITQFFDLQRRGLLNWQTGEEELPIEVKAKLYDELVRKQA